MQAALTKTDFWAEFKTDWVCLDCELMPWSAKAQELLQRQYAAVGSASRSALSQAVAVLDKAAKRGIDVSMPLCHYQQLKSLNVPNVDMKSTAISMVPLALC